MDITEVTTILGTLVSVITPLGGFGAWLYRKQNKRLKEAEAQLAEANVNNAKMQGKSDEWRIWKEQNEALSELNQKLTERNEKLVQMNADKEDRHQQDIKDWEERFTNQTTYLRGVQRDLISANEREKEHIRREAKLEKERDHYKNWRCYREDNSTKEGCGRRKPKQPVPLKYVPLESECSECNKQ